MLEVDRLTKTYQSGSARLTVLDQVTFTIASSETCAVVGPSGSGKTTLLGLCAGLDHPTSGSVRLNGTNVTQSSEDERAALRLDAVGFVFQTFRLIPTLTALQNVMVPAELRGAGGVRSHAIELMGEVGLSGREHHYPAQLSGGEQQRVGLARAFINEPAILFADEPTGNLDTATGARIQSLLMELNERAGTALVVVTHDTELAARCGRTLQLHSGRITSDSSAA